MAAKKRIGLPTETMVEVIGFKDDKVFKKIVPISEALKINKKRPKAIIYQLGFSKYKNVIEI